MISKTLARSWVYMLALVMVGAMAGSALAAGQDAAQVKKQFLSFQLEWFKKLNQNGSYGPQHIVVTEDNSQPRKLYIARYRVLTGMKSYRVKQTGQKASPYVGVLRYEKVTVCCKGHTPEEAKKGPFQSERVSAVTEIFRYSHGKWVY